MRPLVNILNTIAPDRVSDLPPIMSAPMGWLLHFATHPTPNCWWTVHFPTRQRAGSPGSRHGRVSPSLIASVYRPRLVATKQHRSESCVLQDLGTDAGVGIQDPDTRSGGSEATSEYGVVRCVANGHRRRCWSVECCVKANGRHFEHSLWRFDWGLHVNLTVFGITNSLMVSFRVYCCVVLAFLHLKHTKSLLFFYYVIFKHKLDTIRKEYAFRCKFSQLQYYQILSKSVNILPHHHKNNKMLSYRRETALQGALGL